MFRKKYESKAAFRNELEGIVSGKIDKLVYK